MQPIPDLPGFAARITIPDEDARRAASERLGDHHGALGRLGEIAVWFAAVQGRFPASPLERVRLVLVGDQAAAPPSAVVDLAGAGLTQLEPGDDAAAAFLSGTATASDEIDRGTDLLVLACAGNAVPAAALVALLASKDVASVVGHQPGGDDREWMRTCAAVRDAARRGRPHTGELLDLLSAVDGAAVAAAAGVLVEAAARRVPVVLDDVAAAAAALVAQRVSYRAARWLVAGHQTPDPGHAAALDRLRLTPLLDYRLAAGTGTGPGAGAGTGALLAVPHLRAAAVLLTP